jgi:hypothetical protein
MAEWLNYPANFIRSRYSRLAPFYPLFEILFALPWGIRAQAAQQRNQEARRRERGALR